MDFDFLCNLILTHRPHIGFLSVRPDVCRRLPSDSVSRRTPLPLAVTFPLSGRFRDLHPLEYVRAGRTKQPSLVHPDQRRLFISLTLSLLPITTHAKSRRPPQVLNDHHCRTATSRQGLILSGRLTEILDDHRVSVGFGSLSVFCREQSEECSPVLESCTEDHFIDCQFSGCQ